MPNIFDIANVSIFIEKSGDISTIGSWNHIKTELEELGTLPSGGITKLDTANKQNVPFYKTVPSCSCEHKGYVNVCSMCGGLVG